ncbi:tachykinin-4 [Engraulis encrasicolus]|uniref:tachykinin-4 n=1 Tax=Engraulis encrasicolus TaxID=184585 RepID=UPI002FD02CE6
MEMWSLLPLVVLVCSVQGISLALSKDNWISTNWQGEPVLDALMDQEESVVKRSKANQFYGLMGKRSDSQEPVRLQRRRNKGGAMFVGLMGRRALGAITKEALRRIAPEQDAGSLADPVEDMGDHLDMEQQWGRLQYYG